MAQIIVDPDEQRAFADALEALVCDMRQHERALAEHLSHLQRSWADEPAKRFSDSHLEMALYLKAFYNRSEDYAGYLREKARRADKYLDCGR